MFRAWCLSCKYGNMGVNIGLKLLFESFIFLSYCLYITILPCLAWPFPSLQMCSLNSQWQLGWDSSRKSQGAPNEDNFCSHSVPDTP